MLNKKYFFILSAIVLCFFVLPSFASAASLYWVGTGVGTGSYTSLAGNWCKEIPTGCGSANGCNGGAGDGTAAPGTFDTAIFYSTCTNGATVNSTWSVKGLTINASYGGTITQSADLTVGSLGYSQGNGTFTGDTHTFYLISGGAFTTTGGTFTAPTNTQFGSGTGDQSGETLTFNGGSQTFNNVGVSFYNNHNYGLTIATGNTMVVNGTLTLTSGFVWTGTISALGPIVQQAGSGGQYAGLATIQFNETSAQQTYTINGGIGPNIELTNVNNTHGDLFVLNSNSPITNLTIDSGFANTVSYTTNNNAFIVGGNFANNGGTLTLPATSTDSYAFNFQFGNGAQYGQNFSANGGNQTFTNVIINEYNSNGSPLTITTGNTMTVTGTLTLTTGYINTGTIYAQGNVTQANTFGVISGGAHTGGTATIKFTGSGTAQTYTMNGGYGPGIELSKASSSGDSFVVNTSSGIGTLTIDNTYNNAMSFTLNNSSNFIVTGNLTNNGGTFTPPASIQLGAGDCVTQTMSSSGTAFSFNNIIIDSCSGGGSPIIIATGQSITVTGTLYLTSGYLNTGTAQVQGNVVQAATFGVVTGGLRTGGTATIKFTGSGAQTYTLNGGTGPNIELSKASSAGDSFVQNADAGITNLTIDNTYANAMSFSDPLGTHKLIIENAFTLNTGGTFTAPTTVQFGDGSSTNSGSINLNNGTQTFNNVIINTNTTSSYFFTISAGSTMGLTGNFTITQGGLKTGTILFSGTYVQSYSSTGTLTSNVTVNKSGGEVDLASALVMSTANQNLAIQSGTLSLGGNNLTVNGTSATIIVSNGGNLQLYGGETITANASNPQLNTGSTVTYNGPNPYTGLKLGNTYSNLAFNGSGSWTLNGALTVNKNFTITQGTVDASTSGCSGVSCNITVNGNWSNSGTFTARTNTVTLGGTSQSISGNTGFYSFTKSVASTDTLTFAASSTQTFASGGILTLNGALNNKLLLRSSSSPTQWNINPQGTRTLSYLDVQDSNNTNATPITITGLNITDSGHNTNWGFNAAPGFQSGPTANSSSSAPTNVGALVGFTATGTDPESNNYYFAVCRTNSITPHASAAPTCDSGQAIVVSSSTASGSPALCSGSTCSYQTSAIDSSESYPWYAFTCDYNASPLCSSGVAGTPYYVNHAPAFSATSVTTSPIASGALQNFTSTSSDPDTATSDTVQYFACKSNDFNGSTCGSAGTWCSSTLASSNPSCNYTIQSSDGLGTKNYFGYIIDKWGFASSANPIAGTFTISGTGSGSSIRLGGNIKLGGNLLLR